jgi:iron complex transport system permease protein
VSTERHLPLAAVRGMTARRALAIWSVLAAAAVAGLLASLSLGSVAISWSAVAHAVFQPDGGLNDEIVRALRMPRAGAGFACGALLSLSGALLQVLLRNPLADPYVLGVSGGAASFALAAMLLMLPWWGVDAGAFAGALLAVVFVLSMARREFWRADPAEASPRLLLTGVVLAAGWGALITLLLTLAPERGLRGMLFWLAGDLNGAAGAWPALLVLAVVLVPSILAAPQLNVLLRGETVAQALGVPVARLRLRIYLLASLATAAAVVTGGPIGFVGLVVPHMLRIAFGNDQRMLLPAAALGGGTLVMLADLAARTVVAPAQLPVGVITAMTGVPVFLWMLLRRRH